MTVSGLEITLIPQIAASLESPLGLDSPFTRQASDWRGKHINSPLRLAGWIRNRHVYGGLSDVEGGWSPGQLGLEVRQWWGGIQRETAVGRGGA